MQTEKMENMKTFHSKIISEPVKGESEGAFLRAAVRHFLRSTWRHGLRRHKRSVEKTKFSYDNSRGRENPKTIGEYVFMDQFPKDFILVNKEVRIGTHEEIRKHTLNLFEQEIKKCGLKAGDTVLEVGSGDGRNLFGLAQRFPELKFVGLELSPVSVDLAQRMAKQFGVNNVSYHAGDASIDWPKEIPQVPFAFSCIALEMMPRVFRGTVDQLLKHAVGKIVFLEPVPELYPVSLRGYLARFRAFHLDRLHGLYTYLKSKNVDIEKAVATGYGHNPLNEFCLIRVNCNKAH